MTLRHPVYGKIFLGASRRPHCAVQRMSAKTQSDQITWQINHTDGAEYHLPLALCVALSARRRITCKSNLCAWAWMSPGPVRKPFWGAVATFFHQSLAPLQRSRRGDYQGYGLHLQAYERFNTTTAKAYIKPLMKTYLNRLKGRWNDPGPKRLHDDCPWRRGSTSWRVGRLYGG